jgi:hypothetical protein
VEGTTKSSCNVISGMTESTYHSLQVQVGMLLNDHWGHHCDAAEWSLRSRIETDDVD